MGYVIVFRVRCKLDMVISRKIGVPANKVARSAVMYMVELIL